MHDPADPTIKQDGILRRLFGAPRRAAPAGPLLTGDYPAVAAEPEAPSAPASAPTTRLDWSVFEEEKRSAVSRQVVGGAATPDGARPGTRAPAAPLDWSVFGGRPT
jgi:hypothetical protein